MKKTSLRRPQILFFLAAITLIVYFVDAEGTASRPRNSPAKPLEPEAKVSPEKKLVVSGTRRANNQSNAGKNRVAESKKAFLDAYTVFMHPRCMNCHPKGDTPFQGDDSHLHPQGVTRGPDGKGLYANKCSNCHQPQNEELAGEHMPPSHPTWHLPPAHRKMVFEGKSPRALAASFKDSSFTGFATMERFIEHVETDLLVRHSFTYGKRPPLTHDAFVAKVKEWIEKGAVLPDK